MNRRDFILNGLLLAGAFSVRPVLSFGADRHVYKLAPISILPDGLWNTPPEIRDSYRFAVLNRETLRSEMLKIARARAAELNINVRFSLADPEALPFRDQVFDTVVSSASRNGTRWHAASQIVLLEHGRSDRQWLGRFQDRHAAGTLMSYSTNE